MKIDQVITGGGDGGESSLGDGTRLPKTHPRFAAMGDVDELNAAVGFCLAGTADDRFAGPLTAVQQDLFDLGADLSVPVADDDSSRDRPPLRVTAGQCVRLTEIAKELAAAQPSLTSFVLPGGSELAARASTNSKSPSRFR